MRVRASTTLSRLAASCAWYETDAHGQPPQTLANGHGDCTRYADGSSTRVTRALEKDGPSCTRAASTVSPGDAALDEDRLALFRVRDGVCPVGEPLYLESEQGPS